MSDAAIGFNVETVSYKNIKFQVWDLGGQTSIRPYWRCYYPNTQVGGAAPADELAGSVRALTRIGTLPRSSYSLKGSATAAAWRQHTSCSSLHSRVAMQKHITPAP